MDRRAFIKTAGMGGVAFLAACNAHPERHLYALVQAPDDMVTGRGLWYASTCRECPAGCGVLAKNREGRVVKLEGNPVHYLNRGKLCARGQAALQGLYNPDRPVSPLLKMKGRWEPLSFEQALNLVREKMHAAAAKGPDRIAMLSEVIGESMHSLFSAVMASHGARMPVIFEPLGYESLKFAHEQVFGQAVLPAYRMDQADVIIGFGADFLETWLSPVAYARMFKAMHAIDGTRKGLFCQVSAFQNLTAVNADQWLPCRPGSEVFVAMGVLHHILKKGRGRQLPEVLRADLDRLVQGFGAEEIAGHCDVCATDIIRLADYMLAARRPLVMPIRSGSGQNAAGDLAAVLVQCGVGSHPAPV